MELLIYLILFELRVFLQIYLLLCVYSIGFIIFPAINTHIKPFSTIISFTAPYLHLWFYFIPRKFHTTFFKYATLKLSLNVLLSIIKYFDFKLKNFESVYLYI